jgi:Tfp pilus assembly PilM family ATPase
MATKDLSLGLSISGHGIQAVELERGSASGILMAIDEWKNKFPFDTVEGAKDQTEAFREFQEYLSAFIKVNRVKATQVSIALDTALLFLNTLPVEDGLPRPKINELIEWELHQYFPEAQPRDFISDVHVMSTHREQGWNELLSVSILRRHTTTIRDALKALGLSLRIVDVDHFSADMALRINYPDTYRRYLALVGVKEHRLDISLMRNGTLQSYSYVSVKSDEEIVEQIAALSRETKGIYSITVYGPHLDKDILVQIRRGSALLVEALNPLRHITVSDSLRLADHLSVPSYRFASAVGVALRRD